jgi:hypothetical protein
LERFQHSHCNQTRIANNNHDHISDYFHSSSMHTFTLTTKKKLIPHHPTYYEFCSCLNADLLISDLHQEQRKLPRSPSSSLDLALLVDVSLSEADLMPDILTLTVTRTSHPIVPQSDRLPYKSVRRFACCVGLFPRTCQT